MKEANYIVGEVLTAFSEDNLDVIPGLLAGLKDATFEDDDRFLNFRISSINTPERISLFKHLPSIIDGLGLPDIRGKEDMTNALAEVLKTNPHLTQIVLSGGNKGRGGIGAMSSLPPAIEEQLGINRALKAQAGVGRQEDKQEGPLPKTPVVVQEGQAIPPSPSSPAAASSVDSDAPPTEVDFTPELTRQGGGIEINRIPKYHNMQWRKRPGTPLTSVRLEQGEGDDALASRSGLAPSPTPPSAEGENANSQKPQGEEEKEGEGQRVNWQSTVGGPKRRIKEEGGMNVWTALELADQEQNQQQPDQQQQQNPQKGKSNGCCTIL